jgi:hypothetical protein
VIAPRPGYVPREQWSASGLSHDRACRRSYALRYLEGRKEVELTWLEAEQLPEPPKAPKGASAVEKERAKAARKAWNKKRRPACGKASHGIQEAYYRQGIPGLWHPPMAWLDVGSAFHTTPGQILVPGLALMPAPRECVTALIEDPIRLRWDFLPDRLRSQVEADPLTFSGFKDLVTLTPDTEVLHHHAESDSYFTLTAFDPGDGLCADVTGVIEHEREAHARGVRRCRITLRDLKTTYDFAWLKKPKQLATDEQANLYALDVCQRFNLDRVECQWVYCRTEGKAAARDVCFTVLRSDAEEVVTALVERALELRAIMRACPAEPEARHLYVMNLPASPEACDDYGGRDCHASRGGPCNARLSYGSLIKKLTRPRAAEGPIPMTEEQKARLEELRAITDRNFKQKRELAELEKLDTAPTDGAPAAEEKPEVTAVAETKAEPAKAETPAAPKPAAPAKAAKADPPATGAAVCTFDGVTVELPAKSPLAKAIAKVCNARKAYDAALAGEL